MAKFKIGKYKVTANSIKDAIKAVKKVSAKDYEPPYAVWVKVNGKWKIYAGTHSQTVDRGAYLAKGYEDVTVVKNGTQPRDSINSDYTAHNFTSDDASEDTTISALIADEYAAIDAYNVAIENLRGVISEKAIQTLIHIKDEEKEHVEELQAIEAGQEESIDISDECELKDDDNQIRFIKNSADAIKSFADAMSKLSKGQKVLGYDTIEDLVYEIKSQAKSILDVCSRIR